MCSLARVNGLGYGMAKQFLHPSRVSNCHVVEYRKASARCGVGLGPLWVALCARMAIHAGMPRRGKE